MTTPFALSKCSIAERPHAPHALHAPTRVWPETNCYVDLWIELLNILGFVPEAMLGFTLRQDFEGDQFTFFKPSVCDIEVLFGLRLGELSVYDELERHVLIQVARGCPVLVEVDAFHLPDTPRISYRREHAKSTIGILGLDPVARSLDYLHNAGRFCLTDADYDGIFAHYVLPPYAEFVTRAGTPLPPRDLRRAALDLLSRHRQHAPPRNPVAAFKVALMADAGRLVQGPLSLFHRYAFNTTRQLGANFEMLSSHLAWLGEGGDVDLAAAAAASAALAEEAKTFQFQLARAFTRHAENGLGARLDHLAETYDGVFAALDRALA